MRNYAFYRNRQNEPNVSDSVMKVKLQIKIISKKG